MKLLLDQGLPRSTVSHLRNLGIESVHVGEVGMANASDAAILQRARADESVIATLDADFHALLAFSGADSPSVIRIRIEGLRGDRLADLLLQVVTQCETDLRQGAVVSVLPNRFRIRRLPIL